MPTGDDDDGSVWATTLPPHYVHLSAVARGNASLAASLIASPRDTHGGIIATAESLADLAEPVLTALAEHPLSVPEIVQDLPVTDPNLVSALARGEQDRRRRGEASARWTMGQIVIVIMGALGWLVALAIALMRLS